MIFSQDQISFIKSLITQRNKEVRHEVSDHIDNTLPVKKLKSDAEGSILIDSGEGGMWLPPAAGNGYGITSDTSQTGGVKWVPSGQVASGYATITANTSGTGNKISITVTGDNATPMWIEAGYESMTNGTAVRTGCRILDNATTIAGASTDCAAGGTCHPGPLGIKVAAFSGSKTFHLSVTAWGGTPVIRASATEPAYLKAVWMPA